MRRLTIAAAVCLAALTLLAACSIEAAPGAATNTPSPGTPAPVEFTAIASVEGEDYALGCVELSGAYSRVSGGSIMKCLDEQAMLSGSHYAAYTVEGGELVELERHTFSQECELDGSAYQIDFEWCMNDGQLVIPYSSDACRPYAVYTYAAAPERVFVMVSRDGTPYTYPLMVNLLTGEIVDVLSGVELENIANVDISPDGSKLIIICRSEEDYRDTTQWLYDVDAKALSDITDISPSRLGVFFSSNSIISACEPDALIKRCDLDARVLDEAYNSDDGAEILYDTTVSRYILIYDRDRLKAVDIVGGGVTDVSAAASRPYMVRYSPDGTRALLMFCDSTTVTGISVVDFEAHTVAEYQVPEDYAMSTDYYAYPAVNWLDNSTFTLDNGAYGVDEALRIWTYELGAPVTAEPEPVEVAVYPGSAAYRNEELGIAIDFPERWIGHLTLLERYGAEPSVTVCCRELLEAETEPDYSIIFVVAAVNKNDAAALRRIDDPECFTILGERGDLVYYYSNASGRINSAGLWLWFKDICEANAELISEMSELHDKMMDKVEILL